jgi:hypothetical protein
VNNVDKAIKKRNEFFENNPHLKSYQEEIENILNKCSPKYRLDALTILLCCKLNEFAEQLYEIRDINKKIYSG